MLLTIAYARYQAKLACNPHNLIMVSLTKAVVIALGLLFPSAAVEGEVINRSNSYAGDYLDRAVIAAVTDEDQGGGIPAHITSRSNADGEFTGGQLVSDIYPDDSFSCPMHSFRRDHELLNLKLTRSQFYYSATGPPQDESHH